MQCVNLIRTCLAGTAIATALSACQLEPSKTSMAVTKPDVITFGASVETIKQSLGSYCSSIETRTIDPPLIPTAKSQTQIDCEGFAYFGGERKAEFVFSNDALVLTWILVDAEEIPALETAFTTKFGEPTFSKDTVLTYAEHFAGVRKDMPEALYYAEEAAPYVIDRVSKLPDRE